MLKKHPTLGKKVLAEMYFLRPTTKVEAEGITDDSPIAPERTETEEYEKMKNYKWTFYGITRTESRYSQKETRTAFLLNPVQCAPIVTATKYLIPENLKTIHGFDDPVEVERLIRHKLQLALTTSPKTPTLKEKLFKIQKGNCLLCDKAIDPEFLHYKTVHIHHKEPIKSKGSKHAFSNLALAHI